MTGRAGTGPQRGGEACKYSGSTLGESELTSEVFHRLGQPQGHQLYLEPRLPLSFWGLSCPRGQGTRLSLKAGV